MEQDPAAALANLWSYLRQHVSAVEGQHSLGAALEAAPGAVSFRITSEKHAES